MGRWRIWKERESIVCQQTMATSRPKSGPCHNQHTHARSTPDTHINHPPLLPHTQTHLLATLQLSFTPPPLMTDTVECFVSVPLKRPRRPVPRLSDFRPFVSPPLYHINASPLLGARPALTGRLMISRLRSDRVLPSKQTKCL